MNHILTAKRNQTLQTMRKQYRSTVINQNRLLIQPGIQIQKSGGDQDIQYLQNTFIQTLQRNQDPLNILITIRQATFNMENIVQMTQCNIPKYIAFFISRQCSSFECLGNAIWIYSNLLCSIKKIEFRQAQDCIWKMVYINNEFLMSQVLWCLSNIVYRDQTISQQFDIKFINRLKDILIRQGASQLLNHGLKFVTCILKMKPPIRLVSTLIKPILLLAQKHKIQNHLQISKAVRYFLNIQPLHESLQLYLKQQNHLQSMLQLFNMKQKSSLQQSLYFIGIIGHRLSILNKRMIIFGTLDQIYQGILSQNKIAKVASWAFSNICSHGAHDINMILKHPLYKKVLNLIQANQNDSIVENLVYGVINCCLVALFPDHLKMLDLGTMQTLFELLQIGVKPDIANQIKGAFQILLQSECDQLHNIVNQKIEKVSKTYWWNSYEQLKELNY